MRGWATSIVFIACAACEGNISYRGAAVEAPTSGWAFAESANPDHLTPVAGASVTFCQCLGDCACDGSAEDAPKVKAKKSVITDANGAFDLMQFVANMRGEKYVVRATAAGYEPMVYTRSDGASDSAEPVTASRYLVLKMRRASSP